jgi:uncharacterized protein
MGPRNGEGGLCRYLYWIALFVPNDPWTETVRTFDLSSVRLITTEEVLSEFLTAISGYGERMRHLACRFVREILKDPAIHVVPQSHESFLEGLSLYEKREDKQYSLTDCISMNVMRRMKICEVLTRDRHFSQGRFCPASSTQDHPLINTQRAERARRVGMLSFPSDADARILQRRAWF